MFGWAFGVDDCSRQIEAAKAAAANAQRQAATRDYDGATIDGTCEEILPLLAIETVNG